MEVFNKVKEIIGENKSDYSIEEFIDCLQMIQHGTDGDFHNHVIDTFLHDNGFDWEFRKDNNLICQKFLGQSIVASDGWDDYLDDYEEGPYGGAFSSWEDFYNWKER